MERNKTHLPVQPRLEQYRTRNAKRGTRNTEPGTRNPEHETPTPSEMEQQVVKDSKIINSILSFNSIKKLQ
jgi:hypothetical protein